MAQNLNLSLILTCNPSLSFYPTSKSSFAAHQGLQEIGENATTLHKSNINNKDLPSRTFTLSEK